LHRASGKWIQRIDTVKQKTALYKFGLEVFDNKVETIAELIALL
jgi:hypothetical protein